MERRPNRVRYGKVSSSARSREGPGQATPCPHTTPPQNVQHWSLSVSREDRSSLHRNWSQLYTNFQDLGVPGYLPRYDPIHHRSHYDTRPGLNMRRRTRMRRTPAVLVLGVSNSQPLVGYNSTNGTSRQHALERPGSSKHRYSHTSQYSARGGRCRARTDQRFFTR
jgi:hypothetical protein